DPNREYLIFSSRFLVCKSRAHLCSLHRRNRFISQTKSARISLSKTRSKAFSKIGFGDLFGKDSLGVAAENRTWLQCQHFLKDMFGCRFPTVLHAPNGSSYSPESLVICEGVS